MPVKFLQLEGRYHSSLLSKFIKQWFFEAKFSYIEESIYLVFFIIKKTLGYSPVFFFLEILEKVRPSLGLKIFTKKNRKQVQISSAAPYLLTKGLQYKLAIFWLSRSIQSRKETEITTKIFMELSDIMFKNKGGALQKKKEYYRQATLSKTTKKFNW